MRSTGGGKVCRSCCCMGLMARGTMWVGQLAAFGERFRLLVPDLRGHGRTDNPGGLAAMNHRQFGRDVAAFCRALGVERAGFCGESTGAMLLLTLGLEAPELAAALVLAGGTYFYGPELRAWWRTQTPESLHRGDSRSGGAALATCGARAGPLAHGGRGVHRAGDARARRGFPGG